MTEILKILLMSGGLTANSAGLIVHDDDLIAWTCNPTDEPGQVACEFTSDKVDWSCTVDQDGSETCTGSAPNP